MKSIRSASLSILALIILATASLESFSQTSNDSCECIPYVKLRIAAKRIEQGRLDSAELDQQRSNVRLLSQRISAKDDVIRQFQLKDSTHNLIVGTFQMENRNLLDQVALANREISVLQKDVRRQKRKTFFVGLAGIAATVTTFFLFK